MTEPINDEIPQDLRELSEDLATSLQLLIAERAELQVAILAAYELGKRDADAANLEANELIEEAMQKAADKRSFNGGDLMAFLFLLNEYGGTDAQGFNGRIFTTMNLQALAPRLAEYECAKFYLPTGDVEFQIINKGIVPKPATEIDV